LESHPSTDVSKAVQYQISRPDKEAPMSRVSFTDLMVLSQDPLVVGVPLNSLNQERTSANQFFIRNHFNIPQVDASTWSLTVDGEVERTLHLKYDEITGMVAKELMVLLECAGNSRASVQPPIEGLLWDHSGVSTARWKGVSVRAVLERAGLRGSAKEVLFQGADGGKERGVPGEMNFAMSLPLEKALEPDTILAYEMNEEPLAPEHGYPVRVVVPGWFGMTSVKWLTRMRVLDRPFEGYHQTSYYVLISEGIADSSPKERVTSMPVKSLISWPSRGQVLDMGSHSVRGVAWSGHGTITQVEFSVDNGRTWHLADLDVSESPYAWRQWQIEWEARQPGYFLLRARATDRAGNCQPSQAKWNFRGFANNSIHAVPVQVRPGR
jgi:DMSO/TMAO reductase YedYZ molybdopterin-dependent catalytic subunit